MPVSRPWLFRGLALLLAPLVALLLVELGARLVAAPAEAELAFNAPDNAPNGLYVSDHELGYKPTPGFSGVSRSPGYAVPLRVNSLGLRGPEPGDKTGERWLAMGDSFTFAAQVSEADSFVGLLSQGERQVLNGGADGYGSWQALRRYTALDEQLDLDTLLVVFFTGNDLQDNERFRMQLDHARQRPDGSPMPVLASGGLGRWLSRTSFLYAHWQVVQRTRALADPNNPERQRWARELEIFTPAGRGQLEHLLPRTREPLQQLARETQRRGDRLLVAVAPPGFAVDARRRDAAFQMVGLDPAQATPRAPTDQVLELLRAERIPSCDLHAPLQAAVDRGEHPYLDYDGHWTPLGHRVVAQAIEDCL